MEEVTNEPAERLRNGITANEYLYNKDEKAFLADVNAALAAERRATVERIRAGLLRLAGGHPHPDDAVTVEAILAILDAEAQR